MHFYLKEKHSALDLAFPETAVMSDAAIRDREDQHATGSEEAREHDE
jgi:hypothetical protein